MPAAFCCLQSCAGGFVLLVAEITFLSFTECGPFLFGFDIQRGNFTRFAVFIQRDKGEKRGERHGLFTFLPVAHPLPAGLPTATAVGRTFTSWPFPAGS